MKKLAGLAALLVVTGCTVQTQLGPVTVTRGDPGRPPATVSLGHSDDPLPTR